MSSDSEILEQAVLGSQYVPWLVKAGGFIVIDGKVVPITNGVMSPAREIVRTIVSVYAAHQIADPAVRSQLIAVLADHVVRCADELKVGAHP